MSKGRMVRNEARRHLTFLGALMLLLGLLLSGPAASTPVFPSASCPSGLVGAPRIADTLAATCPGTGSLLAHTETAGSDELPGVVVLNRSSNRPPDLKQALIVAARVPRSSGRVFRCRHPRAP